MGAWGHNTFDNDDALDWVGDLEDSGRGAIDDALRAVTDDAEDYIESPDCCNALAAAETVAAMKGNPSPDLPEEVAGWVQDQDAPADDLVAKAKQAVDVVAKESELKELWQESNSYEQWQASIKELKSRLD